MHLNQIVLEIKTGAALDGTQTHDHRFLGPRTTRFLGRTLASINSMSACSDSPTLIVPFSQLQHKMKIPTLGTELL